MTAEHHDASQSIASITAFEIEPDSSLPQEITITVDIGEYHERVRVAPSLSEKITPEARARVFAVARMSGEQITQAVHALYDAISPTVGIHPGVVPDIYDREGLAVWRAELAKVPFLEDHRDEMILGYAIARSQLAEKLWRQQEAKSRKKLDADTYAAITETGNRAAELLVVTNLRYVADTVYTFIYSGVAINDLVQEGSLGLMHVARKWDWRQGWRFKTLATYRIWQRAQQYIRDDKEIPAHFDIALVAYRKDTAVVRDILRYGPTRDDMVAFYVLQKQGQDPATITPEEIEWLRHVQQAVRKHVRPDTNDDEERFDRALANINSELYGRGDRQWATAALVSDILGITHRLEKLLTRSVYLNPVELDALTDGSDDDLADVIPAAVEGDPSDGDETGLHDELVRGIESWLTPREQIVIYYRYGIGEPPKGAEDIGRTLTLEEIGLLLHMTRERIRQIESKAMRKLRHPSRSVKFRAYLF